MAVTQETAKTTLVRQTRHKDVETEKNLQDLYRMIRQLEEKLSDAEARITTLESA